ncbi:MAG: efflux RND transporter permease subunit [Xanthomonadaceae bacterium]|jgi:HAE1 family hydrophobic/amphiphilic exporter-1|nr:efflux RND transporter permease subunit [Xanthomonadaceae bacterium]
MAANDPDDSTSASSLSHGGGIVGFATRRRITVVMVTVTMVLFGFIALSGLKVNLLPDLSYPTLTIRTEYAGAAPAEMETLITGPVEEAVGVVKNLRRLKSVSRAGQSDVVLEFVWGTDMDHASLDVRDKLEALQLPQGTKAPVLLRFNPSTEPIIRLALSSVTELSAETARTLSLIELRRYADEDLKKKLEPISGVAAVKVGGGLEDEIQVEIDQHKLAQLNLSLEAVIDRLQRENVNLSGGRLEEGSQRYLVRTVNQFTDLDEVRNLLVTVKNHGDDSGELAMQQMAALAAATGSAAAMAAAASVQSSSSVANAVAAAGLPVRLKDIADVRQSYKEREAIIRLGGKEAVELAIYKEGDANTVATAAAVKARLAQIRARIPADMELTVIEDQSVFIERAVNDVKKDAVIGGALAILVIFLFLRDGWSTFVISLSLPVSIITTFFFMGQLGLSLNVMSLSGLALATGLVVDDSIVVLESIAKARERGIGALRAAIIGTREVSLAVMASTMTTIAVFLPLVFVDGIAGQLFRDQALTVAIAIAISLVVAMTLIPMLSSLKGNAPLAFPEEPAHPPWRPRTRWQKSLDGIGSGLKTGIRAVFFALLWLIVRCWRLLVAMIGPPMRKLSDWAMVPYGRAERSYLRFLPKALDRPGRILALAATAFIATVLSLPMLGTDLIPQLAQDRFEMIVKLPPGTPLQQTDGLMRQLQQKHDGNPGIRALYAVSGSGTRLDANPTESGENIGKLTVIMNDGGNARIEAAETERLRTSMQSHPNAQIDFSPPALFSFSAPLEVELRGQDLESLQAAGQKLAELLRTNPHYADVKSTTEQGFPEIQIRFYQDRAGALGLTTRQIADAVVRAVRGEVATRYSFRDRKIDILVRTRENERTSIEVIRRLIVHPGNGKPVLLETVAEVVAATGPSEIHHANQTRVAVVSANLRGIDLGTAVDEVRQMVRTHPLGAGIDMHIGGQGEELAESVRSLLFAFGLAIFLVYLVMASQFESLLHPFVILFTIPLAMVGAILALLLTRSTISVVVFIGLILLVGLVTKNAIILIDKVNQLREAGTSKRDALVEGARSRLRPIMMTTLCTLFGFLPLAIASGEGAEVRSPMAITVIGGLLVSTLLTLIVIPIVYDLLDRHSDDYYLERGRRIRIKLADAQAETNDIPASEPT